MIELGYKNKEVDSMITRRRVILITNNERSIAYLARFEAIERIKFTSECSRVWRNNKTPVCLKEILDDRFPLHNVIEVPEKFDECNTEEFIDFCHENGFECGELRTGRIYDTRTERCFLCELANYKGMPSSMAFYNQNVEKEVDCIIYESRLFYVTSELGAIKPAYLMIVPKDHILSVAQFPSGYMSEYMQVCCDVEKILKGAYGKGKPVVFFEHGSGPSGKTSHKKSIVHAHTHVVVDFRIQEKYLEMVQMEHIEDISVAKNVHYFSYQEGSYGRLLISMRPEVYVQRQFPRQVMAEEMGLAPGQYNWRNVEFAENVKAQLYKIYQYLIKGDDIPLRIKERTEGFVSGYRKREDFPQE